jgi:hypothetical protein
METAAVLAGIDKLPRTEAYICSCPHCLDLSPTLPAFAQDRTVAWTVDG